MKILEFYMVVIAAFRDKFLNCADNFAAVWFFSSSLSDALKKTCSMGEMIAEGILQESENKIALSGLNPGIYFIRIRQGDTNEEKNSSS